MGTIADKFEKLEKDIKCVLAEYGLQEHDELIWESDSWEYIQEGGNVIKDNYAIELQSNVKRVLAEYGLKDNMILGIKLQIRMMEYRQFSSGIYHKIIDESSELVNCLNVLSQCNDISLTGQVSAKGKAPEEKVARVPGWFKGEMAADLEKRVHGLLSNLVIGGKAFDGHSTRMGGYIVNDSIIEYLENRDWPKVAIFLNRLKEQCSMMEGYKKKRIPMNGLFVAVVLRTIDEEGISFDTKTKKFCFIGDLLSAMGCLDEQTMQAYRLDDDKARWKRVESWHRSFINTSEQMNVQPEMMANFI